MVASACGGDAGLGGRLAQTAKEVAEVFGGIEPTRVRLVLSDLLETSIAGLLIGAARGGQLLTGRPANPGKGSTGLVASAVLATEATDWAVERFLGLAAPTRDPIALPPERQAEDAGEYAIP